MGKRIGHAKMRYVALYLPIAFVLALAGMLVRQRCTAVTVGTRRTQGTSFVVLATATALILALLTFLPALSLGPSPTACTTAARGLPQSSLPTGSADSATRFRIENPPNAPVPRRAPRRYVERPKITGYYSRDREVAPRRARQGRGFLT